MTNEKAIMCLEDMKIKVPIPKAAKQAMENNEALDVAIKALKKEPHWIPVTERLPKEDGNYLVSGKWGSGKESVGDCEFSVEDGYFQTAWNFDVLAWMPLPEPYKGVTE